MAYKQHLRSAPAAAVAAAAACLSASMVSVAAAIQWRNDLLAWLKLAARWRGVKLSRSV